LSARTRDASSSSITPPIGTYRIGFLGMGLGLTNAFSTNAGSLNAGSLNAGSLNAGSLNAGSLNAGSLNAEVAPLAPPLILACKAASSAAIASGEKGNTSPTGSPLTIAESSLGSANGFMIVLSRAAAAIVSTLVLSIRASRAAALLSSVRIAAPPCASARRSFSTRARSNRSPTTSGGSFSKFAVWLDRAFLKYELAGQHADVSVLFGRFDNPFMATSIIWQDEIGFDGLAFKGKVDVFDGVRAFFTGGMFPIFNTDLNFASNQPSKFKSTDKYLYAAQLGADFKITKDINAKIAAAYYDFDGVEGKLSTPYIPLTPQDQGDTDNTRPSFAQRGNTYRAIRDIIPSVINNFGTSNQYQYFGLASKFQVAQITGRIDFNNWEPYQLSFIGDYVQNTAFDKTAIDAVAVNNRGALAPGATTGAFEGDNKAWLLRTQFGKAAFEKAGDWNVSADYRYVGSDAVVDGFNDNDFGGGGTNVEGFTIGGAVALSKRTRMGVRWFSATQIAGPQFKSDIFMIDINAKF